MFHIMGARSGHQAPLPASRPTLAPSSTPPVPASAGTAATVAKSARAKILALIGGALVVLVGAWFVYFAGPPGSSPAPASHRAVSQQSHTTVIAARAISEPTPGYSTPSLTGHIVADYSAGESLTFTGYCIGQAVASVEAGGTDERWLIRPHGILVPASDLARYSTQAPPVPCPGQKTLQEPRVLALNTQPTQHATLIQATLSHARIVGLALYRPQTHSWEQIAKRIVSDGRLTVPISARHHAAVILAACWANDVPALRPTLGNYVARVIGLPGTPGKLKGTANAATPQGVRKACAPPPEASGKAPTIRRERITKPTPLESTTTPAPTSTTPSATSGQRETYTRPSTKPGTTRAKPGIEQS
jgi:hypothetical protein